MWFRRLLYVALLAFFATQTFVCMIKYLDGDTGTSLKVSSPESISFPSVSLCPIREVLTPGTGIRRLIDEFRRRAVPVNFSSAMEDLNTLDFLVDYDHGNGRSLNLSQFLFCPALL